LTAAAPIKCRVCGLWFTAARWGATTCSSTCRQRKRRGGDLAYIAGLPNREQERARAYHAEMDAVRAEYRQAVQAFAERRKLKRERRHERDLDYVHATAHRSLLAKRDQEMNGKIEMTVVGVLKFFVQERRNDLSEEAIAAFLDKPEFYPVSVIAQALDRLREDGTYDRIVHTAASRP
jgi:hypothetical protein